MGSQGALLDMFFRSTVAALQPNDILPGRAGSATLGVGRIRIRAHLQAECKCNGISVSSGLEVELSATSGGSPGGLADGSGDGVFRAMPGPYSIGGACGILQKSLAFCIRLG
jgi:hypothetical protein